MSGDTLINSSDFYRAVAGICVYFQKTLSTILFPLLIFIFGRYLSNYLELDLDWHVLLASPFPAFAHHTWGHNLGILFLNWMVLSAFWSLMLIVSRRITLSMILFGIVYSGFIIANALKLKYRSEPLLPWDIAMLGQMMSLANTYLFSVRFMLLLPVVLALLILVLAPRNKQPALTRPHLATCLCMCVTSWAGLVYVVEEMGPNRHLKDTRHLVDPIMNISWSTRENIKDNFLPLSLAMNSHLMQIRPPADYAKASAVMLGEPDAGLVMPVTASPEQLPDVIVVLSESFFDVNRFPSLQFDQNPVPAFTEEMKNHGAEVVSPAFGGGTANVEFELLTGLRTASLPIGSIPYLQYLTKNQPTSFPNYLKTLGYSTVAIHPFDGKFWKRKDVYPLLGIDHFIDQEGFAAPEKKGPFISDMSFAQKILEQLDSHPQQPKFIFAASMENHGGYDDPRRYDGNPVHALNAPNPAMKVMLENYATGLRDADQSMAYLAAAVRHRQRPTILVFFGDHLSIPLYMLVDAKLISSDNYDLVTPQEQKKLHTVQALMISNQKNIHWIEPHFQINDMAPQIMKSAGIPVSPYWQQIDRVSHLMPAQIFEYSEDRNGKVQYTHGLESVPYDQRMNLLTFDALFGDQHIASALNRRPLWHTAMAEQMSR